MKALLRNLTKRYEPVFTGLAIVEPLPSRTASDSLLHELV
jgi:hypothetical protein